MRTLQYKERVEIAAPIKDVWKAIIDPAMVEKYYLTPLKLIEPRIYGRIIYGPDDSDMIAGKILEIIPYKKLVHTFMFETPHTKGAQVDPETQVSYELEKGENDGTVLNLTHTGFREVNQTFINVTGGWPMILYHMKNLLEKGSKDAS